MTNRGMHTSSIGPIEVGRFSDMVSVIMPMYNAEPFVREALESVVNQTYQNWELIIVDDCSTDSSLRVAEEFASNDHRIRIFANESNIGAAKTRNNCLKHAKGRFIAYIDADDLWMRDKLEKQLAFMESENAYACFTAYYTIETNGSYRNTVHVPERIDHAGLLKNTITCSHTMMIDACHVDMQRMMCPAFEGSFDFPEDLVVWLQVADCAGEIRGLNEPLAKNRKHSGSRSSNKANAVARTWNVYRKVEGMNPFASFYCLTWQLFHAVKKRI